MTPSQKLGNALAAHALACREALAQGNLRPIWSGTLKIDNFDLRGLDLSYANFPEGMLFVDCFMRGCDLSHAILLGSRFERMNLDGCSFRGASLMDSLIKDSILVKIDLAGAAMKGSLFHGCYLQEILWGREGRLLEFQHQDCEIYDLD